jgi:hypothetical protein
MDFPFTKEVWKEILSLTGSKGKSKESSLIEGSKSWMGDLFVADHKELPCATSWGICFIKNVNLFEGKSFSNID